MHYLNIAIIIGMISLAVFFFLHIAMVVESLLPSRYHWITKFIISNYNHQITCRQALQIEINNTLAENIVLSVHEATADRSVIMTKDAYTAACNKTAVRQLVSLIDQTKGIENISLDVADIIIKAAWRKAKVKYNLKSLCYAKTMDE